MVLKLFTTFIVIPVATLASPNARAFYLELSFQYLESLLRLRLFQIRYST